MYARGFKWDEFLKVEMPILFKNTTRPARKKVVAKNTPRSERVGLEWEAMIVGATEALQLLHKEMGALIDGKNRRIAELENELSKRGGRPLDAEDVGDKKSEETFLSKIFKRQPDEAIHLPN